MNEWHSTRTQTDSLRYNNRTMTNANIGMIGLGVMGQNLALNIERNGYSVAVWDREPAVRERFVRAAKGKQIIDSIHSRSLCDRWSGRERSSCW